MNIHEERAKVEALRSHLRKINVIIDRREYMGEKFAIFSGVEVHWGGNPDVSFMVNCEHCNKKIKMILTEYRDEQASKLFKMEDELRGIEKE